MVDESVDPRGGDVPATSELLTNREGAPMVVRRRAVVSGYSICRVELATDALHQPAIAIRFDRVGAEAFSAITSQNIGKHFAIVFDGTVLTSPNIQAPITGGDGMITNMGSFEETQALAKELKAALPNAGAC